MRYQRDAASPGAAFKPEWLGRAVQFQEGGHEPRWYTITGMSPGGKIVVTRACDGKGFQLPRDLALRLCREQLG